MKKTILVNGNKEIKEILSDLSEYGIKFSSFMEDIPSFGFDSRVRELEMTTLSFEKSMNYEDVSEKVAQMGHPYRHATLHELLCFLLSSLEEGVGIENYIVAFGQTGWDGTKILCARYGFKSIETPLRDFCR